MNVTAGGKLDLKARGNLRLTAERLDDPSIKDADDVARALGTDLERGMASIVLWMNELRKRVNRFF